MDLDMDMEMDRMPAMAADPFFQSPFGGSFFGRRQRPQTARQRPSLIDQMFGRHTEEEEQDIADRFEQYLNNIMGQRRQAQQPQSQGCTEEFINSLPKPENKQCDSDCYICLEKLKKGEGEACQLPCKHSFDRDCLKHWLKDHDSCPVCRMKLDQTRPQIREQQQRQERQQQAPNPAQAFFFNF